MLTVKIEINGREIIKLTAVRKSGNKQGFNLYELDTGDKITHRYEDGAIELAIKMLNKSRLK